MIMAAYLFSMGLFLLVNAPCSPVEVAEHDSVGHGDSIAVAMVQGEPQDLDLQPPLRSDRRDAPPRRRGERDLLPPLNPRTPAETRPRLNPPQLREAPRQVRQASDRETVVMRLGTLPAIDTAKTLNEWLSTEQNITNRPMATVVPVTVSNSLLVTASPDQLKKIAQIIEQLDQPVPQIRIKSVLLKLTPRDSDEGNGPTIATMPKGSIQEILAELKKQFKVRIIAQPELLAVDNTPAMLQLGGHIPRVTGANVSSRGRTNSVSMENVGTIFQATCRVSKNDRITLQIELESSEMGPKEEGVVIAESQDVGPIRTPVIETVTLQTTVTVLNGETVILGGMVYHSEERSGDVLVLLQPEIIK
jgi:type II secretory pathway component GspD/PulD (secretin)